MCDRSTMIVSMYKTSRMKLSGVIMVAGPTRIGVALTLEFEAKLSMMASSLEDCLVCDKVMKTT